MAELKLSNHTISLVSAIGLAWAGAEAWGTYQSYVLRLKTLETSVESLQSAIKTLPMPVPLGNRWTCNDHLIFVYELSKANPKLMVPHQQKVCQP